MILRNGKRIDGTSIDTLPIGTLSPFLGLAAPEGYLLCQGQKVSKTRYKQLYEICGDLFGTSTDTEFYLPDLRGKTLVGYNSNNSSMNTIGKLLGSESHTHTTGNHTLTVDEMPSHNHSYARAPIYYIEEVSGGTVAGTLTNTYARPETYTESTGGGQAHNHGDTGSTSNYQPSFITNWMVKAERVSYTSATVYNGLDSDSEINALSAKQGKILNEKLDTIGEIYKINVSNISCTANTSNTLATLTLPAGVYVIRGTFGYQGSDLRYYLSLGTVSTSAYDNSGYVAGTITDVISINSNYKSVLSIWPSKDFTAVAASIIAVRIK